MTVALGFIGALVTELAAGFGLTLLLVTRRPGVFELAALAWLLGTGVVSFALCIAGLVVHGVILQALVTVFSVSLGVVGISRYRALPATLPDKSASRAEVFLRIVFALELVAIVAMSLQHTLGWDGLTVWELKARYAFLNGGVLSTTYFSDVARWFSHPEYPLLLPLTETWLYLWLGECDQYWVKLLFPIWYLAGGLMLWLAGCALGQRRWVGWLLVLLFPLVPAIHGAPGGVAVGYADIPLGAIYIASILYLLRFLADGSRNALILCLALSSTLPWMKREGAVLWLVISIGLATMLWHRKQRRVAVLCFLPGGLVVLGWKLFCTIQHALPSRDFTAVSPTSLLANIGRLPDICREVFLIVAATQLWDIFWLLALVAMFAALVRDRGSVTGTVCWVLLAPFACYSSSYLFSSWPDYIAHMDTSLPRLLIQLTPAAWLLVALACRFNSPERPGQRPVLQSAREMDCN
jgi:hypothetical protein